VAYGVIVNLSQDGWSTGSRTVFLVLNGIVLACALFILVLAYHVWRGKMWAWIMSLVAMPIAMLFGGLMLLITAVGGAFPVAGIGVVATSAATILLLTVPRKARDYFLRPPSPQYAGAVPGQPWVPVHPPA
jgi:hypothetical protein